MPKFKKITLAVLAATMVPSIGFASGFQLFEYNGADMGNYGAGGAAIAEDASTNFTNPAGLVRIDKPQVVVAATGIWTKAKFSGTSCGGSTAGGLCNPTAVKDDGGGYATVPAAYIAIPIDDRVTFGLGFSVPFGLATSWSGSKTTAFNATDSEIETLNINPNLAVKVTDKFSIGFGLDAMEFKATLDSAVNLAGGLLPSSLVKNYADDWGFGWNAGAMYQFTDATRVGLSYRSQVHVQPTGTSSIQGGVLNNVKSENAKTAIMLPAMTMLSIYHAFADKKFAVMGTVAYTDWNSINDVTLRNAAVPTGVGFGTSTSGTVVLPQDYRSTWRAAIGADYWVTNKLRLRAGVGMDKSPVREKNRTLRLPDEDRYAVAVGAHYVVNDRVSLDGGYTHLFVPSSADINQTTTLNSTVGHVDNSANLLGVQVNWNLA